MTLKEAVKMVIKQNQDVGYNPSIFIEKTKNGEIENLEEVIADFVLDKNLDYFLVQKLEEHKGNLLLIEDLIIWHDFNLSDAVIEGAQNRVEKFKEAKTFFERNKI